MVRAEKEDPNLITVFICFLRSGLRFTRTDTNNVGLAFIEELKRLNPEFKPTKVTQTERDQEYTVNAYPKEFEQLIMTLIEEYRKKHDLPYRLKKVMPKRGGFKKPYGDNRSFGSSRPGNYQGGSRPDGNRGGGNSGEANRGGSWQGGNRTEGGYQGGNRTGGGYQGGNRSGGGYQGGNRPGGGYQGGNRPDGERSGGGWQGGDRQGGGYQSGYRQGGGYSGGNRQGGTWPGGNRPDGERSGGGYQGGNRQGGGYQQGSGYQRRDYNDKGGYPPRTPRNDQSGGYGQNRGDNQGYLEGGYRPSTYGDQPNSEPKRVRENYFNKPVTPSPNSYQSPNENTENSEKPKRPRKDASES